MRRDPVDGSPIYPKRTFRALHDEAHDETHYGYEDERGIWHAEEPEEDLDPYECPRCGGTLTVYHDDWAVCDGCFYNSQTDDD